MNVPYELLHAFLVFAKSNTMIEASKKLGMSQAALSIQLKTLEELLNKPLFITRGKKKELNRVGLTLLEKLDGKFETIQDSLHEALNEHSTLEEQKIIISCHREFINQISDSLIFPGRVEFRIQRSGNAIHDLKNNLVDFVVSSQQTDSSEFIAKKFEEVETHFIIPKRLTKLSFKNLERQITKEEFLKDAHLCSYTEDLPFWKEWCKAHKINISNLNFKYQIDDWGSVLDIIKNRDTIAITPSSFKLDDDCHYIPIKTSIIPSKSFYILYQRSKRRLLPFSQIFSL